MKSSNLNFTFECISWQYRLGTFKFHKLESTEQSKLVGYERFKMLEERLKNGMWLSTR